MPAIQIDWSEFNGLVELYDVNNQLMGSVAFADGVIPSMPIVHSGVKKYFRLIPDKGPTKSYPTEQMQLVAGQDTFTLQLILHMTELMK